MLTVLVTLAFERFKHILKLLFIGPQCKHGVYSEAIGFPWMSRCKTCKTAYWDAVDAERRASEARQHEKRVQEMCEAFRRAQGGNC